MMHLKKSLGQHLLKDPKVADLMIESAKVSGQDTILEIGPGTGFVTQRLLARAEKVIAVEFDRDMVKILKEKFASEIESGKLVLIQKEIIRFLAENKLPVKYKVVASLPYNIATLIIRTFLESVNPPQVISVLIQLEVAQRMCAGEKKRVLLSNFVQYLSQPSIVKVVKPESFSPPPKVKSAILKIEKIQKKDPAEKEKLIRILKAGFAQPRKTLSNNLSAGFSDLPKEKIKEIFKKEKIDLLKRPGELTLSQWLCLSNKF